LLKFGTWPWNILNPLPMKSKMADNAQIRGATENAGLENAAPDCRGGKRGSSTVWKAEVSVI